MHSTNKLANNNNELDVVIVPQWVMSSSDIAI